MNNSLFIPAPFFILRAATYPIDRFESHLTSPNWIEEIIEDFFKDDLFREAILVTSPSLYHAIKKGSKKEIEKVANSLLYYAVRMTNRATPFGLFSFVGTGEWSDQTAVSFTPSDLIKRVRPDMGWIWALIKRKYAHELECSPLKVCTNPLTQMKGDRFTLGYVRYGEKNEPRKEFISIKGNELIATILNDAMTSITVKALTESIRARFRSIGENKIQALIIELFNYQFLLPEHLPSLLNLKLEELPFQESKDVLEEMKTLDSIPLGQGEAGLLHVQEKMKGCVESSFYLQVDLAFKNKPFSLSSRVHEEAAQSVEFLWKLFYPLAEAHPLVSYHQLFLEKYGTRRTIPLLELLDEVKGLGPFESNVSEEGKAQLTPFDHAWDRWIHQRIQQALNKGENEISLPANLVDHLLKISHTSPLNYQRIVPSFDLFCKILSSSQQEIDRGNFELYFSSFGHEGGSSLGRFLDVLGEDSCYDVRSFFEKEEMTDAGSRFVELSYWPNEARVGNVAIQPCLRKYVLDLEGKEKSEGVLTLNDIYVGATSNRLYATDKKGQFEIVARVGNLLTPNRMPEPLRFLKLLVSQKYKSYRSPFERKELENLIFIPRIRYNRTIFSPATWNLDGSHFVGKSKEEILRQFQAWAHDWKLPQFFFIVQADNHLLINREHPACLKKIVNHLKNGERIQFIENLSSAWVNGEKGTHASEIVIPFVKNHALVDNRSHFSPKQFHPVSFDQRWRLPGSDWMYVKFYLGADEEENFLNGHLLNFLKTIQSPWFFVRYRDPDHHVRVRILKNAESTSLKELAQLDEITKFWMEFGLIKNFVITSYEREIERYGGESLIETAEKLFCADSLTVTHLLQAMNKLEALTPLSLIQTLSVIYFLKGFHLDNQDIVSFLEVRLANKEALKGYREHRQLLRELISGLENPSSPSQVHVIFHQAHDISQSTKELFLKEASHLTKHELMEILDSLLHMHCNRLMGDSEKEQSARQLAFKSLFDEENRRRCC